MKKVKSTTLFLGVASAMAFAQDGAACIPFVNGQGNYGEHCYNSGLRGMAEGKCYTMNPDRANENPVWINEEATQDWWWKVVDCVEAPASSSSEEPVSSSSSEEPASSSSEKPASSSSEEPASSSSEEPESSSSEEVSSSSEEPASSSSQIIVASKCEEFVRGAGNYTTDKCYNAGLADMEEGKCYKLKDERANDVKGQQWINDRANDSWWWEETECGEVVVSSSSEESSSSVAESSSSEEPESSSSSVEESSSSVEESSSSEEVSSSSEESSSSSEIVVSKCVEFVNGSGDYNGKCFNAGLNDMAEGKCYALNSERGQVNDLWINNRAADTYWWSEVACADESEVVEEPIELVCKGDDCADDTPILKSGTLVPSMLGYVRRSRDDSRKPNPKKSFSIDGDEGTTGVVTAVEAKSSMVVSNNVLNIATTSNGSKSVKVFSVRGDVLLSETFSGASKSLDMSKFAGKGAVIVRLVEGRKVLATKRIAVR